MHLDPLPTNLLLIMHFESGNSHSGERISRALAALACAPMSGSRASYRLAPVDGWCQALRELADACTCVGDSAWLVAELPPPGGPREPYRRMHDRSVELAADLRAWRTQNVAFPALQPGDMVRL